MGKINFNNIFYYYINIYSNVIISYIYISKVLFQHAINVKSIEIFAISFIILIFNTWHVLSHLKFMSVWTHCIESAQ